MIFYFSGSSVIGIVFGIIFIDIGLQGAYIKSNRVFIRYYLMQETV
jgi:hypothetical protein